MPLREEMEASGQWLFRQRSFLPLLLGVLFFFALQDFHYPDGRRDLDRWWKIGCLAVALGGVGLRVLTIGRVPFGTSGRNTQKQVARELNTTGMYSLVRNPLYLGNFLIWLGVCLLPRVGWFSLLTCLLFWLYYERIIFAEEEFLRRQFGDAFLEWAARTPAFIPRFRGWTPSPLPFSWRTVVRREYSTVFAVVAVFFLLEVLTASLAERRLVLDPGWTRFFLVGAGLYLIIRVIKKKTALLQEAGR